MTGVQSNENVLTVSAWVQKVHEFFSIYAREIFSNDCAPFGDTICVQSKYTRAHRSVEKRELCIWPLETWFFEFNLLDFLLCPRHQSFLKYNIQTHHVSKSLFTSSRVSKWPEIWTTRNTNDCAQIISRLDTNKGCLEKRPRRRR